MAVGGVLMVIVVTCLICMSAAIAKTKRHTWHPRAWYQVVSVTAQLCCSTIGLAFLIVPNAYVLYCEWGWFTIVVHWSGVVRWTCWNTVFWIYAFQASQLLMMTGTSRSPVPPGSAFGVLRDRLSNIRLKGQSLSLWACWTLLTLIWVVMEIALIAFGVLLTVDQGGDTLGRFGGCHEYPKTDGGVSPEECTLLGSWFIWACPIVFALCLNTYYVLIILWVAMAAYNLQKVSYTRFRIANIVMRLQLRTMVLAVVMMLMSNTLLWTVQFRSCNSYVITWLGMLPLQVCTVGLLVIQTFLSFPRVKQQQDKPLASLRQFTWSEARKDALRARRGHPEEPMFCFETALKSWYWSYLVYEVRELCDERFDVKTAMLLWQCDEIEMMWEGDIDTRLMMGWGPGVAVLAFRGTQSAKNIVTDLSVILKPHPLATTGKSVLFQRPRVHAGFHDGWTHNSFNLKVLDKLSILVEKHRSSPPPLPPFQVITTGHSLGGALATLAAYEISLHFQHAPVVNGGTLDQHVKPLEGVARSDISIQCYTFGAPRAGNHAFAAQCNACVPDLWNLINDRDVIVHRGKALVYKRPGQRVTINLCGDIIVRPGYLESNTLHTHCLHSVDHHLLSSYRKSMAAIVASQFDAGKGCQDGACELMDMCRASEVFQALMSKTFGIEFTTMKAAMLARSQNSNRSPLSKHVKPPTVNWNALLSALWPLNY